MYLDQIHSIYIYSNNFTWYDSKGNNSYYGFMVYDVCMCNHDPNHMCVFVRCVHWFDASFVFIVVRWSSLIQFTFDLMMMKIICPLALAPIALCVCVWLPLPIWSSHIALHWSHCLFISDVAFVCVNLCVSIAFPTKPNTHNVLIVKQSYNTHTHSFGTVDSRIYSDQVYFVARMVSSLLNLIGCH